MVLGSTVVADRGRRICEERKKRKAVDRREEGNVEQRRASFLDERATFSQRYRANAIGDIRDVTLLDVNR